MESSHSLDLPVEYNEDVIVMSKDTSLQQINLDPLPRENMEIQGAEEGGTIDVRYKRRYIVAAILLALSVVALIVGLSLSVSRNRSSAVSALSTSSSSNSNSNTVTGGFSPMDVLTKNETPGSQFDISQMDDDGLGANQPTFTEQVAARRNAILDKLNSISGEAQVKNKTTPQNAAAKWIVDVDAMQLDATSPHLEQRYVIALLYYALGGEYWDNSTGYLTPANECLWYGIRCTYGSSGNVTYIQLGNNSLVGSIPNETGVLQSLQVLNISANIINGTIPETLYDIKSLIHLDLSSNALQGFITTTIGKLASLGIAISSFVFAIVTHAFIQSAHLVYP
jgi:hypothetical protein